MNLNTEIQGVSFSKFHTHSMSQLMGSRSQKFVSPEQQNMSDKPHDVTAPAIVEFTRNLFRMLAARHGRNSTLNELRIMNQVILCRLKGRSCCVTALHKVTGIPVPTVSRAVANLQSDGWLSDRQDPADGRKRIIFLSPRSLELTSDDINGAIRWINDFREHGLST